MSTFLNCHANRWDHPFVHTYTYVHDVNAFNGAPAVSSSHFNIFCYSFETGWEMHFHRPLRRLSSGVDDDNKCWESILSKTEIRTTQILKITENNKWLVRMSLFTRVSAVCGVSVCVCRAPWTSRNRKIARNDRSKTKTNCQFSHLHQIWLSTRKRHSSARDRAHSEQCWQIRLTQIWNPLSAGIFHLAERITHGPSS